jgi:hypothetical protein
MGQFFEMLRQGSNDLDSVTSQAAGAA